MPDHLSIILFYYPSSPWSRKLRLYLALRRIPHIENIAPIALPRPTFEALGISYRRIPILSIGRDVYVDTLLILLVLEKLYPPSKDNPAVSARQRGAGTEIEALEYLLEKYTDLVTWQGFVEAVPYEAYGNVPGFAEDREDCWGRSLGPEQQGKLRPDALAKLRGSFAFLENLLADGRMWVGGEEGPFLADIHAAWIFAGMFDNP